MVTFTEEILNGKRHFLCSAHASEMGLGLYQTFMMQVSAKIEINLKTQTVVAKCPIVDVSQGRRYVSVFAYSMKNS